MYPKSPAAQYIADRVFWGQAGVVERSPAALGAGGRWVLRGGASLCSPGGRLPAEG